MTLDNCNVFLNVGSSGALYSGDIVTGSVTLTIKSKVHVQRFLFRVIGVSKAQWTRASPTIPYIKIYAEKKKVLDIEIDVFDHFIGQKIFPGIETQKFHFSLPPDLPSTFKSSLAKVEYYIKIECKSKLKLKQTKITPFVVIGRTNLNHLQEYVTPSFYEVKKKFRVSGSFAMSVKIYKGFAPSQSIPVEIILCNEDKVLISKIKVGLFQKLHHIVTSGYADIETKVCKLDHHFNSSNEKLLCKLQLEVPQVTPSSIHVSNPMIDISYFIRVEAKFPFHFTCYEDFPVTIAAMPVLHYDYDLEHDLLQEIH